MKMPKFMIVKHVKTARQTYSDDWSKSSKTYRDNGYYNWCLNSIKGKLRILEIGCGVGHSTVEIVRDNHIVISIEENPFMLDLAEKNLTNSKVDFKSIRRENFGTTDFGYHIDYADINDSINVSTNVLIEGNILTDKKLQAWLMRNPPFDAVICWFMGVQSAIVENDDIQRDFDLFKYEPMRYRQSIQMTLFKIGDIILKPGGIINLIDRTQLFESDQQKTTTLETYREVFGVLGTSIDLCYIDQLEIDDPTKIHGVKIKMTQNNKVVGSRPNMKFAITSMIGIKK
jgi:SAM-dependent methyltransferase